MNGNLSYCKHTYVWGLNMLESWKHCVASGWTDAAAAKAEAKKEEEKSASWKTCTIPWQLKKRTLSKCGGNIL